MTSNNSRTRLLNSLGLFQEQQQKQQRGDENGVDNQKRPSRHTRYHSEIPVRSALHHSIAFETKLNDEKRPPMIRRRSSFSGSNDYNNNNNNNQNQNNNDKNDDAGGSSAAVRFNTVVEGVEIPSRNQYSKRIKQQLWRDRHELHEMVERNTTEFHAENYDWQQVVLDDEMYIDSTNGERVHPCHVLGNEVTGDDDDNDDKDNDDDDDDDVHFTPLASLRS